MLVLPFRDPVAFAKEWATLDQLSGGRSILGVGVGWNREEFAALRIPIEERGRRMNEMLESITALWAGDDVSYEGQYYRFEHLTIEPKPAQKPHPPIWIGGGTQPSEKIYGQGVDTIQPVLRRIAKYASTWVPHSSRDGRDGRRRLGRASSGYMVEIGRDPDEHAPGVLELRAHPRARREAGIGRGEVPRLLRAWTSPYWQEFYLLGEAEAVAERIRGKIEALGGVDHLILNPLDWDPAIHRGARRAGPAARRRVARGLGAMGAYLRPADLDDGARALAGGGARRRAVGRRRGRDRPLPGAGGPGAARGRPRRHGHRRAPRHRATVDGGWRIGALTTWTDLVEATLPPLFDGLRAAALAIGGLQIQARATIAGNVCNASPAADGVPNLLALDAVVELVVRRGRATRAGRRVRDRQPAHGARARRARDRRSLVPAPLAGDDAFARRSRSSARGPTS